MPKCLEIYDQETFEYAIVLPISRRGTSLKVSRDTFEINNAVSWDTFDPVIVAPVSTAFARPGDTFDTRDELLPGRLS